MFFKRIALFVAGAVLALPAGAQYKEAAPETADGKVVLTLDDALKIALSENTSVKVADIEIERQQYARKGSYASLLPQVSASGMYSYALKKQKVYFGSDKQDDEGGSSGGGGMAGMMASLMNLIMYYIEQLYAGTGVPFVLLGIFFLVWASKKRIPAQAVHPEPVKAKKETTHYAKPLNSV